jgi:outer membrane protein assembly factor BamB
MLKYSAALIVLLISSATLEAGKPKKGVHWPSFRGPDASGIAEGFDTLVEWNVPEGKGVKWKTPIPGLGHSSPVIWGDRIYVTTAISGKENAELKVGLYGNIAPVEDDTVHRYVVYCLDKKTGEIIWEKTAFEGVPKIKRHTKASHANCTPATDGKSVVAFFGSEGLFVYDQDGELVWKKDLGVLDGGYYVVPEAQWEFGSSPIIHQKRVYVQCDVQGESFVAAYKLKDGEEVWRTVRDEVPTWGTPTVHGKGKKAQLIVNGYKHIGAYNADNGKPVWWLKGGGDIPVPTPVLGHGLVYITNAHGSAAPMYAIDPSAKGDLSFDSQPKKGGAIRWYDGRSGAYMQTPLVYGEFIYSCSDNGTLTTYDAKSGKNLGRQRLGDGSTGFTASAVAANEHLYYTGEEGDVIVLQVGPTPKVVATNSLGEVCMATPAISEGVIYFRGRRHLIAVGK